MYWKIYDSSVACWTEGEINTTIFGYVLRFRTSFLIVKGQKNELWECCKLWEGREFCVPVVLCVIVGSNLLAYASNQFFAWLLA